MITGLLKLSYLNLMPVQWGRVTESMLTHPSTLKRVQRIAALGQLPESRLQQLLQECHAEAQQGERAPHAEEIFSEAKAPEKGVTSSSHLPSAQNKLWLLWFLHLAPPAVVAWAASPLPQPLKWPIYAAGAIGTVAVYFLAARWMMLWGRLRIQQQFFGRLRAEGVSLGAGNAQMVGIAPGSEIRFYVSGFSWDTGCLLLAHRRLCYYGDQTRFALRPEQVREIRLGPGAPGWSRVQRVYLDWWDEKSASLRTWNMICNMPCSLWSVRKQSQDLYNELLQWRRDPESYPELPEALQELPTPPTGEVTSMPLKTLYSIGRQLNSAFVILFLALALGVALHVPALWYVCSVIVLLRVYEALPHMLFRPRQAAALPAAATVRIT